MTDRIRTRVSRRSFLQATGGTPNDAATFPVNRGPTLTAIGLQEVAEAVELTFQVTATDPDTGTTFTYSLGPGGPPGATIGATSGVFRWRPTSTGVPRFESVTVRVTDNGNPQLSHAETFGVSVVVPAQMLVRHQASRARGNPIRPAILL